MFRRLASMTHVHRKYPRLDESKAGPYNSANQHYRNYDSYILTDQQRENFFKKGWAILPKFLTEEELAPIEEVVDMFLNRKIPVPDKDFCDISGSFNRDPSQFSIINCMLPRKYYPALKNNIYEKLTTQVANDLHEDVKMELDYDQLLNKHPSKEDAVFAWHQDMAYWPPPSMTPDTRAVTFSLAIDKTSVANGCIRFASGTQLNKSLREHKPLGKTREEAHGIATYVGDDDEVEYAELERGDVSIHDEWIIHGSGGNLTNGTRRTYVVAFRPEETVRQERSFGFTHSHNDNFNWDTFNKWDKQ